MSKCVTMSTCQYVKIVIMLIFQPVNMSTCQYFNMSMCQYFNMSICQHVIMWTCHYVTFSACQYVNVSQCQSVNMSACQHLDLSTCLNVNMSICQNVNTLICQHVKMFTNSVWFIVVKAPAHKVLKSVNLIQKITINCKNLWTLFTPVMRSCEQCHPWIADEIKLWVKFVSTDVILNNIFLVSKTKFVK